MFKHFFSNVTLATLDSCVKTYRRVLGTDT